MKFRRTILALAALALILLPVAGCELGSTRTPAQESALVTDARKAADKEARDIKATEKVRATVAPAELDEFDQALLLRKAQLAKLKAQIEAVSVPAASTQPAPPDTASTLLTAAASLIPLPGVAALVPSVLAIWGWGKQQADKKKHDRTMDEMVQTVEIVKNGKPLDDATKVAVLQTQSDETIKQVAKRKPLAKSVVKKAA